MIPGPKTSITVQEETQVSNGQGGFTVSWGTRTGYPKDGVIAKSKGDETVRAGKESTIIDYVCYLPNDSGITNDMRISADGNTYDIETIDNPQLLGHHMELGLCKRD